MNCPKCGVAIIENHNHCVVDENGNPRKYGGGYCECIRENSLQKHPDMDKLDTRDTSIHAPSLDFLLQQFEETQSHYKLVALLREIVGKIR